MLRLMILMIMTLIPVDVHAGWVEERWTDSQGNNHRGTVSPPPTSNNPNHSPPGSNNVVTPQQPTTRQIEHKVSTITAAGAVQFNAGDYDGALDIWMKAYNLCQQYGMSTRGCYELDSRMVTAMAYRDSRAYKENEKREAELAEKRREAEHAKQRAEAKRKIHSLLEDTAVDFDGTGRGIDLTPMSKPTPAIAQKPSSSGSDHQEADTVDLRFMDPDKLEAPKLQETTPAIKERGVHYKTVPLPEALLPKDPKERFAMKDSVTHIMKAIKDANGDLAGALQNMDKDLRRHGANNQAAQEAYSYLSGLYVSEIIYGDKKTDPFRARQNDSQALIEAFSDLEPQKNEPLRSDAEAIKNEAAIHDAFKSQNEWLERTLVQNGGDLEKSLRLLRQEKESGARGAYRFIQGLVAYHDMATMKD